MAPVIYLDTHIVVWLYAGRTDLFGAQALEDIRQNDLVISPMVTLELEYLREIKRLKPRPQKILDQLGQAIGLKVSDLLLGRVVAAGLEQSWTRDPFDRLIVGHAAVDQARLLTKDSTILAHYRHAYWA
jgi:PIN domain nuclease of toxin-antitoxin system